MCLAAIYWARVRRVFYANTRHDAARIGFDDDWIHREVARPLRRRALPMEQVLRDEALAALQEWERKADKVPY